MKAIAALRSARPFVRLQSFKGRPIKSAVYEG